MVSSRPHVVMRFTHAFHNQIERFVRYALKIGGRSS